MVEQKGKATLLFFHLSGRSRARPVDEIRFECITSHAVAGNFHDMRNAYYLEARREQTRLIVGVRMTPDFLLPPLSGTMVPRMTAEKQFGALIGEILRRMRSVAQRPAVSRSRVMA